MATRLIQEIPAPRSHGLLISLQTSIRLSHAAPVGPGSLELSSCTVADLGSTSSRLIKGKRPLTQHNYRRLFFFQNTKERDSLRIIYWSRARQTFSKSTRHTETHPTRDYHFEKQKRNKTQKHTPFRLSNSITASEQQLARRRKTVAIRRVSLTITQYNRAKEHKWAAACFASDRWVFLRFFTSFTFTLFFFTTTTNDPHRNGALWLASASVSCISHHCSGLCSQPHFIIREKT